MEEALNISYHIYLEADDIAQSRIAKTIQYTKNLFDNCNNVYFKNEIVEDESDFEDFMLRLYVQNEVSETAVTNQSDAKSFVEDMMIFLQMIAQAQSYAHLEGDFSVQLGNETKSFRFVSEEASDTVTYEEQTK